MAGMMMSFTSAVTIPLNADPMTNATARSIRFPLNAKFLKSLSRDIVTLLLPEFTFTTTIQMPRFYYIAGPVQALTADGADWQRWQVECGTGQWYTVLSDRIFSPHSWLYEVNDRAPRRDASAITAVHIMLTP
jgi:hypothetical protein